jgi:phospholipid/cholesterol/gamma-HCH transport system permease protein
MKPEILIEFREGTNGIEIVGSGSWTAINAARLDAMIRSEPKHAQSHVKVDMSKVYEFDTYGAWLLERLLRSAEVSESVLPSGLPERFRGLFDRIHETNRRAAATPRRGVSLFVRLEAIGRWTANAGRDAASYFNVIGALSTTFVETLVSPRRLRFTSLVYQLDRVGFRSIPIIALITLLIGAIIAQQGIFHFRRFGADDYVVDLVGILILREIGVLIVSIMVAGRSGSSYTAELGSMKMREEIDALRTMGRDPVEVLVLPRVAALVIALPLLTFIGSMAALYGGGLVAWLYGGLDPGIFVARLREAVSISDFMVGMIKSPFMALVIGVVACTEGMKVKGSSESLGSQTTSSVVKSIFAVIVMDGLFAMFFSAIGM